MNGQRKRQIVSVGLDKAEAREFHSFFMTSFIAFT